MLIVQDGRPTVRPTLYPRTGFQKACCTIELRTSVEIYARWQHSVCVKMADGCMAVEAKVLETVKLSCLPSYPGAISWSLDDRVSVITDQCVYILVSF